MKYCCEAIEQVMDKFGYPFYVPILINRDSLKMQAGNNPAIKLLKMTPAGNISKKGGSTLIMSYCPLCGTEYGDDR